MELDFRELWREAIPYGQFAESVQKLKGLWDGVYRTARIPDWAHAAVRVRCDAKLLAINEDWCWDGANVLPPLARLSEETGCLRIRVIGREEHPELMDRYLTTGSRSVPVLIVLDSDFRELGHWGPRPAELQAWFLANRDSVSKEERYRQMRLWHAKDKAVSTFREVLSMVKGDGCGDEV